MTIPTVSVVVPSYNAASYLDEFCRSVQAQNFEDFEMLIGDDGSTDRSIETIQPYLKDKRFKLIAWKPNEGVHFGITRLLTEARGTYWCNPGSDDLLLPNFLEQRVKMLGEHPEASLIHGPPILIDRAGLETQDDPASQSPPMLMQRIPPEMSAGRSLRVLIQHNIISTPSIMARMDLTRQILPFYAPYWQWALDWYLWILIAATGFKFLWDPTKLHKYRLHPTANSRDPAKGRLRQIERRLVPLHALRTASLFSPMALRAWCEMRKALYYSWLCKATALIARGKLDRLDFAMAAEAYYGGMRCCTEPILELARHGVSPWIQYWKDKRAIERQFLRVSGIPSIDDPLFRK